MRLSTFAVFVAALAVASSAEAARLVVLAVNSGSGTTSGAQPPIVPGAKGFLIGIDNTIPAPGEAAEEPLAFLDLTFMPTPVLVQRLAPNTFANGDLSSPNVQWRSETVAANMADPVAGSSFAANDSWWWNEPQNGFTLTPVQNGVQGGLPGGPMSLTGSLNVQGVVPRRPDWKVAYIITTRDVRITGVLAGGQYAFDLATGEPSYRDLTVREAMLNFNREMINIPIPEPQSLTLTGAGVLGLAFAAWQRRKKRHARRTA